MRLTGDAGHLTYCTNIHPGETWDDLLGLLGTSVPAVKRLVCPDRPFGIGLRCPGRRSTPRADPIGWRD